MLPIQSNLIRYLFVLRVNSSMVWMPSHIQVELSCILAQTIAKRLPTAQARPWKKMIAKRDQTGLMNTFPIKANVLPPDIPWPIEATLFVYPTKKTYSKDDLILWELKLIGASADHAMFMEVILPAMEQIGFSPDSQWKRANALWGHFEIQSIYTARGTRWKPLIKAGKIDLRYKVLPTQWRKGLSLPVNPLRPLTRISWIQSVQLLLPQANKSPTLDKLVMAAALRMALIEKGPYATADDWLKDIPDEQKNVWRLAYRQARKIGIKKNRLKSFRSKSGHSIWQGNVQFKQALPPELLAVLFVATIFHVGARTHYGWGTFVLN